MKILEQLQAELLTARKNKNKEKQLKLNTIKSELDLGVKEGRIKTDQDIVNVLMTTLKKYQKSIDMIDKESGYAISLKEDIELINNLIPDNLKTKIATKEEVFEVMTTHNLDQMGTAMKYFKSNNYDMKNINSFVKEYLNK